jgi:hypothetical protein
VKRPLLGFLAAVLLTFGFGGLAPARADTPKATTAMASPAHGGDDHDGDHDGYKYSHPHGYGTGHRQHPRHGDGDDDDHDGRRRRCSGLIVICLV